MNEVAIDGAAASAAALDGLGLDELREVWRARYGAPPALRSAELLGLMLAWRIQAEVHGGLDADLRRLLRRPASVRRDAAQPLPRAGTKLTREWQGAPHQVTALVEGGFIYNGDRYRSLSQVARVITGSRWNGPRFFGLRAEA